MPRMCNRHGLYSIEVLIDRIISRGSAHHWPAYSADLSCLNFSFWSLALDRMVESEPKNIQELKKVLHDFVTGISEKQLRKMSRYTRHRAELCVAERGGSFEHL